mmetsp:Transcript_22242/g.27193  ORF Transcript_22242/g.27193 Transcript_22242/m.27193 type:complete len:386 (+) Transcript_22242:166-1323(+)|eukprot:CAMPEP_0204822582 /NCGR_PEP_ID=MMETSP1346-20131115/772_1 /ASSEMBLY_ACC=CAM_ASM_000771 /TAXON_ID=215587 /ORGANISM="Aplanochytrium stocchinoi, Strain GSBS06" /LENGTH=385 /DNA_ID=CAMNT_0051948867 /DNA_START=128 /DNA_END=1285 /DNA_ORIENTATION=-
MLVTFTNEQGTVTEQLDLQVSMEVAELKGLLEAILGIPATQQVFVSSGRELHTSGTLESIGVRAGDMILVVNTGERGNQNSASSASAGMGQIRSTAMSGSLGAGLGGGGLVQWDGMSLHDVLENNTNPKNIAAIIRGSENIMKELRFHNPKLREAMEKDEATAIRELRTYMMMNTARNTMSKISAKNKQTEMENLRRQDPNNPEVQRYFADKESDKLVQESYTKMMNEYPEALTKVLMLYIHVEINGVPVQAFVDSGAQTSVISAECANRVGITNLIDKRFAGAVVGVGTGSTLGRVHLVPLNIAGNFFPVSLTVMDDSKGLGDKNMEFLLGLDMLKRHRATIDLVEGVLRFQGASGFVSTPFLHEKDLPESKGGTKGFDPNSKQ